MVAKQLTEKTGFSNVLLKLNVAIRKITKKRLFNVFLNIASFLFLIKVNAV